MDKFIKFLNTWNIKFIIENVICNYNNYIAHFGVDTIIDSETDEEILKNFEDELQFDDDYDD